MPPGQTHGPHTLTVLADGPGGTAAPDTERWWISDRFPATPSFDSTPSSPSGLDVSFSFSDTEAGVAFLCALDRSDWAPCSSPQQVDGLAVGDHSFAVAALDGGGSLSFPAVQDWHVQDDITPPSLAMKKPAVDALLTARTIAVQWTATDADSGLDRVEVRQTEGLSGTPVLVQSGLARSFTLNDAASGTYCYQVTAFDRQGNSRTGKDRCAAVPLDDRELGFTGPVTLLALPAAFDATATRMTGAGSTSFTFTGRNVGVLFRKGPDLGKALFSADGGAGKVVDLYGSKPKALWWTKAFASSGPHTVTVTWLGTKSSSSTAADVAVDGVAAIADAAPQPT